MKRIGACIFEEVLKTWNGFLTSFNECFDSKNFELKSVHLFTRLTAQDVALGLGNESRVPRDLACWEEDYKRISNGIMGPLELKMKSRWGHIG